MRVASVFVRAATVDEVGQCHRSPSDVARIAVRGDQAGAHRRDGGYCDFLVLCVFGALTAPQIHKVRIDAGEDDPDIHATGPGRTCGHQTRKDPRDWPSEVLLRIDDVRDVRWAHRCGEQSTSQR
jgi:hypothetical protein